MAQRVTITIPDSLHDRLQAVKDRINVSGICQEAIMHAVGIEEIKKQDLPESEQFLARLQKEREKHEIGWKDQGFEEGRKDAQLIHYVDFLKLEDLLKEFAHGKYDVERANYYKFKEFIYNSPFYKTRTMRHSSWKGFNPMLYRKGWIEGVISAWESVRDKILPAVEEIIDDSATYSKMEE